MISMMRRVFLLPLLAFVIAAPLGMAGPVWAIDVDHPDDLCAPTDDPCLVTVEADLKSGTTLDFGLRTVVVTGSGLFDFNSGSSSILCGGMTASVSAGAAFLKAREVVDGEALGGVVRITARRGCSDAPTKPCLQDSECTAGTCSVGSGAMNLDGQIFGSGVEPGSALLRAAGDIVLLKSVTFAGLGRDSDGGELELISAQGSVTLAGSVTVPSGSDSEGGVVTLIAAVDVIVSQDIDASGGDFNGGTIDIDAGRDYRQAAITINASALFEAGEGGTVFVEAGRDLFIEGAGASNRARILTSGHGAEGFGGDAGEQEYQAGGNIVLNDFAVFENDGAAPDGSGGDYFLQATGDITMGAEIAGKTLGSDGGGGQFSALSDAGDVNVGESAVFTFTGGSFGGGFVQLDAMENCSTDGLIDLSAASGGSAGGFDVLSQAEVTMSGTVRTVGASGSGSDGELLFRGCRLEMTSGSSLDNRADEGRNLIEARETFTMRPLTSMTATGQDGSNTILHRRSDRPPVLNGTISPAPAILSVSSFPDCPVCGNGEVERSESCDDGNVISGDGCDEDCVDEDCIADTPGYPVVTLCNDGDLCTDDSCSPSGCVYSARCDDGIDCTVDSCVEGDCTNAPDDQMCNDQNGCTDDICIAEIGCASSNNTAGCDDAKFCTVDDTCDAGVCLGAVRDCDDAVGCTDDSCDELGDACVQAPSDATCDDGAFCNGDETCDLVSDCQAGVATDCTDLDSACTSGVCDDGVDGCVSVAISEDEACDDGLVSTENDRCVNGFCIGDDVDCSDGFPCTADRFDQELERCVSTPDDAVCNDRQFCNGDETCSVESGCLAGEQVDCSAGDGTCVAGACNEVIDRCGVAAANEGVACDDGMFCTVDDACTAGVCTGPERDCADEVSCTLDGCNDTVDECRNIAQDLRCDDDLFCNGIETCSAIEDCLVGDPVDCSELDDVCEAGVCLEEFELCGRESSNEGGICDDGDDCTTADSCDDGLCLGNEIADCDVCGNGIIDDGETCDDGDTQFAFGEACDSNCDFVGCAKPTASAGIRPKSSDALYILRSAVGLVTCDPAVCDANGDTRIRASDALLALNAAVGADVTLLCPAL
ncbi:MAG: hypothetical protein ACI8TX_001683 [Hyphomicrobiaceae bacterium]|jgi:hypothetical protein